MRREVCAKYYLEGYPEKPVVDPIKDIFPSCSMPRSCTVLQFVSPIILENGDYAQNYIEHVARIRELLDLPTFVPTRDGLRNDNHPLFRELGCYVKPSEKTVPPWSVIKHVVRWTIGDQLYAHTSQNWLEFSRASNSAHG